MTEPRPKRVVLHAREDELEDANPHEAIQQYFDKINRPYQEIENGRHYVQIHRVDPNTLGGAIYIIIDMEKDKFFGQLDWDFPHEMYNLVCIDNLMIFMTINRMSAERNIQCQYTNQYPWAGREDGDVTPGEPVLQNGIFHE